VTLGPVGEGPPVPAEEAGAGRFEDERSVPTRTLVALSKVGLALREQAWKETSPRGLNPTQAQVLKIVARADESGIRLSAIADQHATTPAVVTLAWLIGQERVIAIPKSASL